MTMKDNSYSLKKNSVMKRIISFFAIAGLLTTAACQRTTTNNTEAQLAAQQHTIDSMQDALARQHIIDSMNTVVLSQQATQKAAPAVAVRAKRSTPKRSVNHSSSNTYAGYSQQPVYTQPAPQQAPVVYQEQPVEQKKGWSAKAKGAVIGAGVGAASGAIINKRNRGAGAIIGGVLGAGVGTGVGAVIDKKNGR